MSAKPDQIDYEGGGLEKETNWWGAFVIGLAGTILVTGIAPVMVTSLGASAIPVIVIVTITGYLLCLLLAELSAMMPERTGGSPSYAYPAYKEKWPNFAKHVNGFTAWAYWLGWFPVAPLNMILASFYITEKFSLSKRGFTPIHTPIAYWTIMHLDRRDPARLHSRVARHPLSAPFRDGARTRLDDPAHAARDPAVLQAVRGALGQTSRASSISTERASSPTPQWHNWLVIYIAFAFLLTWNVIAMEAAACYIGECRDPDQDAKIAMNLEGLYGLFIYTMIPIAFVIVFGASKLSNAAFADPRTIFSNFAERDLRLERELARLADLRDAGDRALALGAERDHGIRPGRLPDGARRAVPAHLRHRQQARRPGLLDGLQRGLLDRPHLHGWRRRDLLALERRLHGVVHPGAVGYYLLRRYRPDMRRPFRLPEFMKYVALALALFYFVIWLYGGIVYTGLPNASLGGANTRVYYFIGWALLLAYVPLYLYRTRIEDPKHVGDAPLPDAAPTVIDTR